MSKWHEFEDHISNDQTINFWTINFLGDKVFDVMMIEENPDGTFTYGVYDRLLQQFAGERLTDTEEGTREVVNALVEGYAERFHAEVVPVP